MLAWTAAGAIVTSFNANAGVARSANRSAVRPPASRFMMQSDTNGLGCTRGRRSVRAHPQGGIDLRVPRRYGRGARTVAPGRRSNRLCLFLRPLDGRGAEAELARHAVSAA